MSVGVVVSLPTVKVFIRLGTPTLKLFNFVSSGTMYNPIITLAKGIPIARYELLKVKKLSNVIGSIPIFAIMPPNKNSIIVNNLFCFVNSVIIIIAAATIAVCNTLL